jgi:hypothetical protein
MVVHTLTHSGKLPAFTYRFRMLPRFVGLVGFGKDDDRTYTIFAGIPEITLLSPAR